MRRRCLRFRLAATSSVARFSLGLRSKCPILEPVAFMAAVQRRSSLHSVGFTTHLQVLWRVAHIPLSLWVRCGSIGSIESKEHQQRITVGLILTEQIVYHCGLHSMQTHCFGAAGELSRAACPSPCRGNTADPGDFAFTSQVARYLRVLSLNSPEDCEKEECQVDVCGASTTIVSPNTLGRETSEGICR